MLTLQDVTKAYPQGQRTVHALRGVSLCIGSGEFVAIMGPSGSGKSTLLHLLGALDVPTSGSVQFAGHDLKALSERKRSLLRRRQIGFVFQAFNLLPTLTAAENVALPLQLAGRRQTRQAALLALERMGLLLRVDHYPEQLSGGEMQRVAIARALVTDPDLILCDEPTGNLDSVNAQEILSLLRSLPDARRSVVMVTHDRGRPTRETAPSICATADWTIKTSGEDAMLSLSRTLSWRYWGRCRIRCGLVLLSIALGVATCVATGVLDANLEKAFQRSATPLAGFADLYVSNGDAGVPLELAEQLRQIKGVGAVQPVVVQQVALPDLGHQPALLLGVDMSPEAAPACWTVTMREFTSNELVGALFLRHKLALVTSDLEQALPRESNHVPSSSIRILIAGQVRTLKRAGTIHPRGTTAALAGHLLVLSSSDAAALLGRPDLASRLDLSLVPGADRDFVLQLVKDQLAGRATVATPEQHGHWVEEMVAGLRMGLRLIGVGALVVGLFLVGNVLAMSVAERRRDIGILKSIGACPGQVVALLACEAILLGLAGGLLGVPLGLGLARLGMGPVQKLVSCVFLPVQTGPLVITVGPLLGALALGVCTALLASVVPALQAGSISPIESLRRLPASCHSAMCPLQRRFWLTAVLGLLACALAWVGMSHLPQRVGSYGTMVLVLLAGLVVTPLLALAAARCLQPAARRWLGSSGRLALDNLVLSPGRTGLVITTLSAGVALFVQTAGFLRSNETAIKAWVEHSITGDLFVTSGGPLSITGQNLPMSDGLLRPLAEVCPEAQVVPVRFRNLEWQRNGLPSRILLFALDAERYWQANKDRGTSLPDLNLFRGLSTPGTALVSNNFSALYGIQTGDSLTLPGAAGPVTLRVIGTVEDYTCSRGTVIVDRCQHRLNFDAHLVDAFNLYLPPGTDVESVRQRLQKSALGTDQAFCLLTRDALRGHILGMILGIYGLAYAQECMVAVVALLAMITALLLSVLQRRRELGLLRAIGATPAQVFRSVLAESFFMGILGTATGLLAGVPLEWYTVRVLLFGETGTLLPVHFPWITALRIFGLMLVGAALASLGPALRAGQMRIADALACE